MPRLEEYVSDIYNRAFVLARESDEKIKRMEAEYKEYVKYTLGKA
jgi:hypothetical protein